MALDKRKVGVLEKLALYGKDTEKKAIAIDKVEVIDFCLKSGLKLEDVHTVYEIQDALKRNRIYSYLTGGTDEKEEKPNVKPKEFRPHEHRDGNSERPKEFHRIDG